MKRWLVVHPLLVAAYPVLALYQHNLGQVPLRDLWVPLGLVLVSTVIIWGLWTLALRNVAAGGLIVSLWWVLFFSYGHLRTFLHDHPWPALANLGQQYCPLLQILAIVFLFGTVVITVKRRHLGGAMHSLNLVALLLVGMSAFHITQSQARQAIRDRRVAQQQQQQLHVTLPQDVDPEQLPNIYVIVLDAYARADTLRDIYHYDNRPFLDELRKKGFLVANHSRSNYPLTYASLASCLNMRYLDDIVADMGPDASDWSPVYNLVGNNALGAYLEKLSYRRTAILSGYFEDHAFGASTVIRYDESRGGRLSEFAYTLANTTPLCYLLQQPRYKDNQFAFHRQRVRYALDHLPDLAYGAKPILGIAHIISPHPPFVLDAQGNFVSPRIKPSDVAFGELLTIVGTRQDYLTRYPQQMAYINAQVLKAVTRLQASSGERPTVIVVMSDHGPDMMLNWDNPDEAGFRERIGNLCAVYCSDGPLPGFRDDITLVNLFPLILNRYFRTKYPPREEKCYFLDYNHPYRQTDVTAATEK